MKTTWRRPFGTDAPTYARGGVRAARRPLLTVQDSLRRCESKDSSKKRAEPQFVKDAKPADATIQVEPSTCRDMGVIKLKLKIDGG